MFGSLAQSLAQSHLFSSHFTLEILVALLDAASLVLVVVHLQYLKVETQAEKTFEDSRLHLLRDMLHHVICLLN